MGIEVNIDPEQVNAYVAGAILQSAIGAELKKAIDKAVADLSKSHDNPMERFIKDYVQQRIVQLLNTEYHEQITAKIREALAEKLTSEFVGKIIENGLERRRDW